MSTNRLVYVAFHKVLWWTYLLLFFAHLFRFVVDKILLNETWLIKLLRKQNDAFFGPQCRS